MATKQLLHLLRTALRAIETDCSLRKHGYPQTMQRRLVSYKHCGSPTAKHNQIKFSSLCNTTQNFCAREQCI
jgi:hypothetical protein